jgi:hypothetical protein
MHSEHRHKINQGTLLVVVGLLVILNQLYSWITSWPLFIGLTLLILGFLHMMVDKEQIEAENKPVPKKKK